MKTRTDNGRHSRYVALFDILGFRRLVNNNQLDRVVEVFAEFRRLVDATHGFVGGLRGRPTFSIRLFSDTIVIYSTDDSIEAFGDVVKTSQLLLGLTFCKGILLRGAITKGPAYVDDVIVLGTPITRAYEMEQSQEWVGCWIDDGSLDALSPRHRDAVESHYQILQFDIPLKAGPAVPRWALNWVVPLMGHVTSTADIDVWVTERFFSLSAREAVTWDVRRKLVNTIAFLRHAWPKAELGLKRLHVIGAPPPTEQ